MTNGSEASGGAPPRRRPRPSRSSLPLRPWPSHCSNASSWTVDHPGGSAAGRRHRRPGQSRRARDRPRHRRRRPVAGPDGGRLRKHRGGRQPHRGGGATGEAPARPRDPASPSVRAHSRSARVRSSSWSHGARRSRRPRRGAGRREPRARGTVDRGRGQPAPRRLPVVLLGVTVASYWLAGRALAPVEAIRTRVAQIQGTPAGRPGPGARGEDEITRLAVTMNAMLGRLEDGQRPAASLHRRRLARAAQPPCHHQGRARDRGTAPGGPWRRRGQP